MFLDARSDRPTRPLESDVCVVGAGAAGIPLALALAESGLDVHLIESGGFVQEEETQRLYNGEVVGLPYPLSITRLRYFGGTTNHWGGICRPLDPWDFELHPWIDGSGWPISRRELDPYYARAGPVVDLGPTTFEFDPSERGREDEPPLVVPGSGAFERIVWRRSGPTRMGLKYRQAIERSKRIRCFVHTNATKLVPHESGKRITSLEAATLNGRALTFSARYFVLCTGAIENARLLLLSDSVERGGVGNRYDLVGRYFSDHLNRAVGRVLSVAPPGSPIFQEARFLLSRPGAELLDDLVGFTSTPALRAERELLGFSLPITSHSRLAATDPSTEAVAELLAAASSTRVAGGRDREIRQITLAALAEQSPNPDSRVFLIPDKDQLGLRKIAVDWRLHERDRRSIRESMRQFAAELGRTANVRVRIEDLEKGPWIVLAGHQIGTTRMSNDPMKGVTDANARVHGVANLFITGSSLFPTGGFANPTLTIVALTLRLADHLAKEARRPRA